MSKVVVVYHSGYGHTERVADFVAQGANAQKVVIDADGNVDEAGIRTRSALEEESGHLAALRVSVRGLTFGGSY